MVNPMLAKKSEQGPFNSPEYIFEIKWDGERAIAFVEDGKVQRLQNRKGGDISKQFPEIIGQPVMAQSAILDAEIVVFNGNTDVPSFKKLSERSHLQDTRRIALLSKALPAYLMVFDLLSLNGQSIMEKPLIERKDLLHVSVPIHDERIGISMFVKEDGELLFSTMVGMGHEGVMAKHLESKYTEGKRSDAWLKIKPSHKSTCVVTGYTKGNGARASLGALHISEEVNGQLIERGRVGSGLSAASIYQLLSTFKPTGTVGEIVTVNPCVKIEVSYFERNEDSGHYRFPVFKGVI
jgi:bifunctional non-homologous end joining protein LigD